MHAIRLFGAAALAAAFASAQVPCWEPSFGTFLGLGDDAYAPAQPLGFTFTYGGVGYTDIVICSNGYVWLGQTVPNNLAPDYSPTEAELTTQGPRIAPMWEDFNPGAPGSGNVYFNTFPAGGGNPARAVITWDNVYEYSQTTPLSLQLTLLDGGPAGGSIIVHYDSNMSVCVGGFGSNSHVIGCSNGIGVSNPVNFGATPIVTAGNPTLHQSIARGVFPLVGKDFQYMADGAGGFVVTERATCNAGSFLTYGTGCPRGMSTYEIFNGAAGPTAFDLANQSIWFTYTGSGYVALPGPGLDNGYSNPITLGDDTILTAQPVGFNFPFANAVYTAVDLSSNGMIYMNGATHGAVNGYPTVATLLNDPVPIIGFLWEDLDLSAGGQAYWDVVPGASAMFTIVGAPYWGIGGANTAQLKLLANGDFIMSWGAAASTAGGPCMVAISEGNGANDFGPTDWSASLPVVITAPGTVPLSLAAQAGSRPAMGQTFTMELGNIPAGTAIGAMILSFTQQHLNAAVYGMGGCYQLVGLDATFVLLTTPPITAFGLPIPGATSVLGTVLYAQGATFSSGYNSLGVIASNGGELRIGL